jgi:hypothetical protein
VPYLCDTDDISWETIGAGFYRTTTLDRGCDRCDFRYTKHGHTTAPWPPDFVERGRGQPPTTPTEAIQTS